MNKTRSLLFLSIIGFIIYIGVSFQATNRMQREASIIKSNIIDKVDNEIVYKQTDADVRTTNKLTVPKNENYSQEDNINVEETINKVTFRTDYNLDLQIVLVIVISY